MSLVSSWNQSANRRFSRQSARGVGTLALQRVEPLSPSNQSKGPPNEIIRSGRIGVGAARPDSSKCRYCRCRCPYRRRRRPCRRPCRAPSWLESTSSESRTLLHVVGLAPPSSHMSPLRLALDVAVGIWPGRNARPLFFSAALLRYLRRRRRSLSPPGIGLGEVEKLQQRAQLRDMCTRAISVGSVIALALSSAYGAMSRTDTPQQARAE